MINSTRGLRRRVQLAAAGLVLLPLVARAQTATTTTLTSVTPASPLFGQTVTLKATVAPAPGSGSVAFMDGVVLVGVGNVGTGGVAMATTITLPAGVHSLRAVYGGSSAYKASKSSTQSYTVKAVQGSGFAATAVAPTGINPYGVAVGDFNGDGNADLAVANHGSNTVTILLGNGKGVFSPPPGSPPATGNLPTWVVVSDFNGDGKADLAVVNNLGSANVSILLGNGDGTFAPAASPATGTNPYSAAVGDFNGDGKADLAVANFSSNTVSILLGNGDGTFAPAPGSAPVTGNNPTSVAVGDFNGDGVADLAVANYTGDTVTILLGNGDGTFSPAPASPPTGKNPTSLVVADFLGNGKADLATANFKDSVNTLSILLGNGSGAFTAAPSPATGAEPYTVAVGDFNADGKADLAVANYGSYTVSILLGNGDGTFSAAPSPPTGNTPYALAVGDFNGDGVEDLAVSNYNDYTVSILLAQPFSAYTPCDVDHYGSTTVADIQQFINEALGVAAAVHDLNLDSVVNVVDVQIAINSALGLGCSAS